MINNQICGYEDIDRRPLRYFFARVEKYICDNIGKDMESSVHYISTKTGHKTGYHIEHIISRNEENKKYVHSGELDPGVPGDVAPPWGH